MVLQYFLCFITIFGSFHSAVSDDFLVTLPNGVINGSEEQSYSGKVYYNFQKIPYAAPPVGDLRFRAPVPPDNWDNVLSTIALDVICNQQTVDPTQQSEDCLYINVFTPELPTLDKNVSIPVLLYIYGGGFVEGHAMTYRRGPEYLIDYDVVIVTFNYRLGPFGFLSTGDLAIPGNNGLKDQHLAIQWVHDNIHLFGGDPDRITIVGESAGGASVGHQLLNPNSEGLFRAAIMESGTPINSWTLQRNPRDIAFFIATMLNSSLSNIDDTEVLLEYLQSVPAEDLNQVSAVVSDWKPVIEVEHEGAFITEKMYQLVRTGGFVHVPILMGINSEESLIFNPSDVEGLTAIAEYYDNKLAVLLPPDMDAHVNEQNKVQFGQAIRQIYCGNQTFADTLAAVVRYSSDNMFSRPGIRCAELMSQFTPVFFYQFSYDGPMGNVSINIEGTENVAHAEELRYIWRTTRDGYDNSDLSKFPLEDVLTQRRMLTLWTNFVKFLNPTPQAVELLQNVMWPTTTSGSPLDFFYLDINADLEVRDHPKGQAYLRWLELFAMLGTNDFETF